jgi:hypothetical protein
MAYIIMAAVAAAVWIGYRKHSNKPLLPNFGGKGGRTSTK